MLETSRTDVRTESGLKPARKLTREVLEDLSHPSLVAVNSHHILVGRVEKAAMEEDKKRRENESKELRRKPILEPLPKSEAPESISLAPWHVLHWAAYALALSRQGAGRGLAEHWGSLKYCQAMDPCSGLYMQLSEEGKSVGKRYKQLQGEELGHGFALALAEHVLSRRFPDRCVAFGSGDIVLRAGWPKKPQKYHYQPTFFAELWKPGEPSIVIPIAAGGNHDRRGNYARSQLARGSAHVEAVHIGPWNETPCLIISTELPRKGPVIIYALHAPGKGGRLTPPSGKALPRLDSVASDKSFDLGIKPPPDVQENVIHTCGYHVLPKQHTWFHHVLARTVTAGITAFTGDGDTIAHYLTKRQGSRRYSDGIAHAATASVQDVEHELLRIPFTGTDHVFRLNNERVEAFSGLATDLFALLSPRSADGEPQPGRLERYREEVYARRGSWPGETWDEQWGGPVSVHEDGTVLAIRLLPA